MNGDGGAFAANSRDAASGRTHLARKCEQLQSRVKNLEREKLQLDFLNKQNSSRARKLEKECLDLSKQLKEVQYCGACKCLAENRSRPARIYTAKVQDVPMVGQKSGIHSADIFLDSTDMFGSHRFSGTEMKQKISSLKKELEAKQKELDRLRPLSESSTAASLLVQKDEEIDLLKQRRVDLEKDIVELTAKVSRSEGVSQAEQKRFADAQQQIHSVQNEMRQFEEELIQLRTDRERILAENDLIRQSLHSKETNLQRCEKQLSRVLKERDDLSAENASQKAKERVQSEGAKLSGQNRNSVQMQRWKSETQLEEKKRAGRVRPGSADPSRTNKGVNPYCPVCRNYKAQLSAMNRTRSISSYRRKDFTGSPDSGFSDKDSSGVPEIGRKLLSEVRELSVENRRLTDEIERLSSERKLALSEKESANRLCKQIDFENRQLRQEVMKLKAGISSVIPTSADGSLKLCQENERFKRELQDAQSRLETESARYDANVSLLNIQKSQLEKEKNEIMSKNEKLQSKLDSLTAERGFQRDRTQQKSGGQSALLRAKDSEITRLKSAIKDLHKEYEEFRGSLREQEEQLMRLQHDLSVSESLKGQTEKQNKSLSEEQSKIQQQLTRQIQDNMTLQRELEQSIEEQERLKLSTQLYLNEVQTYEKLLAEKERERMDLLIQLQGTSVRPVAHRLSSTSLDMNITNLEIQALRTETESLKTDKAALLEQERILAAQVTRCEESVEELKKSLRDTRLQNESLHADLTSVRQLIVQTDAEKIQLSQQLKEKDTELNNLRSTTEDLRAETEVIRGQLLGERESVRDLKDSLSSSREQHIQAAVDVQEKTRELRDLRVKVGEYETQLELQGRELKRMRERLEQTETDLEKQGGRTGSQRHSSTSGSN